MPPPADPLTPEDTRGVERRLGELGFLKSGPESVAGADQVAAALKAFQKEHALHETGIYDEPTLRELALPNQDPNLR